MVKGKREYATKSGLNKAIERITKLSGFNNLLKGIKIKIINLSNNQRIINNEIKAINKRIDKLKKRQSRWKNDENNQ